MRSQLLSLVALGALAFATAPGIGGAQEGIDLDTDLAAGSVADENAESNGVSAFGDGRVHGGERSLADIRNPGERVRQAQHRLHALGYWVGPVDGMFGALTEQAVYAFQKYEGLPVNGELDARTLDVLSRASRPLAFTTSGDIIEIDKSRQLLFFVQDGAVAWVFNASTGEEEPYTFEGEEYFSYTPNGRHEITREIDDVRVAPLGPLYRPRYFTTGGHAIHGYTHVPPEPASHGCVRVSNPAMDFIWATDLAPIGVDVWVFGTLPS